MLNLSCFVKCTCRFIQFYLLTLIGHFLRTMYNPAVHPVCAQYIYMYVACYLPFNSLLNTVVFYLLNNEISSNTRTSLNITYHSLCYKF